MSKSKRKVAPVKGAAAGNSAVAWPFPKSATAGEGGHQADPAPVQLTSDLLDQLAEHAGHADMLQQLSAQGVVTLDDLADVLVDDLTAWTGLPGNVAHAVIANARKHWFPAPGDAKSEATQAVADRVRVDQVSLYVDPAKNTIERLDIQFLTESPFNPRKRFDQVALNELAETIRGVGVMQPILVRPMHFANTAAAGDEPRMECYQYEIVFGHRRYRAAKIAGETTIPAIVRELTDVHSAQLQAIENVQRKDLDAIDEALGYQHYIEVHGVNKDQLAKEIGLSRSHVYARLKLLTLPDEVREAHVAGEIAIDVALAIARLHTPAIQAKALAALRSNHHDMEDGGKKSVRNIKRFLAEKFTLDLDEALFDTANATLLEGADACTSCPKRSANAPEYADLAGEKTDAEIALENDLREADDGGYTESWNLPYGGRGGKNRCTDPDCYEAKKKAHLTIEAGVLTASGKTVIAGAKARSIVSATGEIKGGYVALKDVQGLLAKGKKKKPAGDGEPQLPPQVQVVVVQDPRDGKAHEVVKVDDVKAAGAKIKPAKAAYGSRAYWDDLNRKRNEEHTKAVERAKDVRRLNYATLGAVRQAAAGRPLPIEAVHLVAQVALAGVGYEDQQALCSIYGVANWGALHDKVGAMQPEHLTTLLLDCALVQNVHTESHTLNRKAEALQWAAGHYGVDVEEIRSDLAIAPAADDKTPDLLEQFDQGGVDIDDDQAAALEQEEGAAA